MEIDVELLTLFQTVDTVKQDIGSPLREATNDITTIASVGFLFYKSFIFSVFFIKLIFANNTFQNKVISYV